MVTVNDQTDPGEEAGKEENNARRERGRSRISNDSCIKTDRAFLFLFILEVIYMYGKCVPLRNL
jgi:hypothetical protein